MNPKLPAVYDDTVFVVESPPDPLPAGFAIVTAWNPLGSPRPPHWNHHADRLLKAELAARRLPHWRATGCAPDRSHCEPGWAIETDLEPALGIARLHGQLALWWIELGRLELVACDGERRTIANFHDRIIRE